MKKILAGLLSAALALGCLALPAEVTEKFGSGSVIEASAANGAEDFYFDSVSGTITEYIGTAKEVVIPSTINGVKVLAIGACAFRDCPMSDKITSVVIPDTVSVIDGNAFWCCTSLKSVTLPKNLKYIGVGAFYNTAISSIKFRSGVKEIEQEAFLCCNNLKSVTIPYGTTEIGDYAFGYYMDRGANYIKSSFTINYYPGTAGEVYAKAWKTKANQNYTTADTCKIVAKHIPLTSSMVKLSQTEYIYDGTSKKPAVTVTCAGNKLERGKDYSLEYSNNTNWGTATVKVKGAGAFSGVITKEFKIYHASISGYTVTLPSSQYTYSGTAVRPSVTVKNGSKTLKNGTDYNVVYYYNKAIGTATVIVTGTGNYKNSVKKTFTILPAQVKAKTAYSCTTNAVRINWNKVVGATGYKIYRYNPTTKKWTALKAIYNVNTLNYRDDDLKSGTVYKYKVKAFKKVGEKFYFGKSCDTITTVTRPSAVKITGVNRASSAVRLYWNKVSGASGYKIQRYDTASKSWKTVNYVSYTNNNYRISGLKSKTTYKFRILAYKYDGRTNVPGGWTYKSVTTL